MTAVTAVTAPAHRAGGTPVPLRLAQQLSARCAALGAVPLASTGRAPPGAHWLLAALVGTLVLVASALALIALLRRRGGERRAPLELVRGGIPPVPLRPPPSATLAAGGGAGMAVAVGTGTAVLGCPTCRRQYEPGLQFCPYDARRLAPRGRLDAAGLSTICAMCRRTFDATVRFCPHDATELMPLAAFDLARGGAGLAEPVGVVVKMCPQCARRFDLAASFCGHDGAELVMIN